VVPRSALRKPLRNLPRRSLRAPRRGRKSKLL
jgi:hypothetical protein